MEKIPIHFVSTMMIIFYWRKNFFIILSWKIHFFNRKYEYKNVLFGCHMVKSSLNGIDGDLIVCLEIINSIIIVKLRVNIV